jgi:LmbE family N-acetylglucosaminyl deacetylase
MSRLAGGRIVVLSPHLDDGVFSLGASIARAARDGASVKVVTVFGNDPDSDRAAAPWDSTCGFRSEGEAAAARREEDKRACRLVGAEPVWLPFRDEEYGRDAPATDVWDALADLVAWGDTVVCPGFPLEHADHEWLTDLAARHVPPDRLLGLYVEQPYASWRLIGRGRRTWAAPGLTLRRGVANLVSILARTPAGRRLQRPTLPSKLAESGLREPTWTSTSARPSDWRAKLRAVRAYESQLRHFGPLVPSRMALYELGWGGEGLAWIER